MGSKITVIGAGSVGSTITHILSLEDFVSELVMIDILKDKADGEVMDMVQGVGFRDPVKMISGDYADAVDSDIVIITSGVARKPGQTRIELARTNVNIIKDIAPKISEAAPNAMYIMVSRSRSAKNTSGIISVRFFFRAYFKIPLRIVCRFPYCLLVNCSSWMVFRTKSSNLSEVRSRILTLENPVFSKNLL